ncbi:MAG: sigma factor-like helix-turn-helix DNA-binding protein [Firmicutes bacterium]|nr:sigma factor-like helix-turn-helix DNA-binding protein [Bacillota bacterium]
MKENISTVEYASMLYDFYGELLSEARKDVMNLYHEDNFSLSEIADELGMTRQAVHYTLKKAEAALEGYEEKLGLVAKYRENEEKVEVAKQKAELILKQDALSDESKAQLADILSIIEEITE